MANIISIIGQYVSSFLGFCSQPVYFIIYIYETNYEAISAVFAAIYSCLFYFTKACYLLVYGLASMVEYIIVVLIDFKDVFIYIAACIISLTKRVLWVLLHYGPWIVCNVSDGAVWLHTSLMHFVSLVYTLMTEVLPTPTTVFECLKASVMFCYGVLGAAMTLLMNVGHTLFSILTGFISALVHSIISAYTFANETIHACVVALQIVESTSIGNFATITQKYINIGLKQVYYELAEFSTNILGSFFIICITILEVVSYIVIFAAIFIPLIAIFIKLYGMYTNAINSANSLMDLFHRNLFRSGNTAGLQHEPVPPHYTEQRIVHDGDVSDAESDDSLLNNMRHRVPQPQLGPRFPRESSQARDNSHLPNSSGECSQRQTTPLSPQTASTTISRPNTKIDTAKLAKQLEEERDRQLCVVCQDSPKNILILPCKHLCICQDCVEEITNSSFKKCPLCRVGISSYLQVYA